MEPMLATSCTRTHPGQAPLDVLTSLDGWHFDMKWDGVRAIFMPDGTIRNRRGIDVTERWPDLVMARPSSPVDGEIIAFGLDGRPSFNLISKRDRCTTPRGIARAARSIPAYFMAFDVVTDEPWIDRQHRLADRVDGGPDNIRRSLTTELAHVAWSFVIDNGLEGVIAKDPASRYVNGRSEKWIKVKRQHSASVVVTGIKEGEGSRSDTFGALVISVHDGDDMVEIGKVGTGFTQAELARLNLLARNRPLVVEVSFHEFTDNGRLRFPVYEGVRTDVPPEACTINQFRKEVPSWTN